VKRSRKSSNYSPGYHTVVLKAAALWTLKSDPSRSPAMEQQNVSNEVVEKVEESESSFRNQKRIFLSHLR
jgi:hypothetical protein